MPPQDQEDDLLARIYDAAFDETLWQGCFEIIRKFVGAETMMFVVESRIVCQNDRNDNHFDSNQRLLLLACNLTDEFITNYEQT